MVLSGIVLRHNLRYTTFKQTAACILSEQGSIHMTNEQLALRAKKDDAVAQETLFLKIQPLLYHLASSYFPLCTRAGITVEDLKQDLYFAFLQAIKAYDPQKQYAFNSYLNLSIRSICRTALGIRNKQFPPTTVSLDTPIHEDLTLWDTLIDTNIDLQSRLDKSDLYQSIKSAIASLPRIQQQVIFFRYIKGMSAAKTANKIGVPIARIHTLQRTALLKLRRQPSLRALHDATD